MLLSMGARWVMIPPLIKRAQGDSDDDHRNQELTATASRLQRPSKIEARERPRELLESNGIAIMLQTFVVDLP